MGGPVSESARREVQAVNGVRGCGTAVVPDYGLHAIFEMKLAFFEGDFFDLLVVGKVVLGFELDQAFVEFVMLGGQLAKLVVGLEEQMFHFLSHRGCLLPGSEHWEPAPMRPHSTTLFRGIQQSLLEDQRIFYRMRIVVRAERPST